MCGIFGTFKNPAIAVEKHLGLLRHRGPDAMAVRSRGDAVHGHARLSLVDLSEASNQPFEFGDALLSFNGEIWNFKEVRAELEAMGRRFQTSGDTEVLAAALSEWGLDGLKRLEGMFAFAWSRGDRHYLARDRFGKIPLYVRRKGPSFVWSSERKAMPNGGTADPLPPGSILDLTDGSLRRWYRMPDSVPSADPIGELKRGIGLRLFADAPICCLISGGLDSSLILALAKNVRPDIVAYTAVLDRNSTDLKMARMLCDRLEVELREATIEPPTLESLSGAARCIEIASKAQIEIAALCLPLAERISRDGFKACLSGEAADELFGGYGNMCIKAARADDAGWREIRLAQLEKMGRGNFVRCNKAFMAHGVECRLPFMHRPLVESVVNTTKELCPPGKKALKRMASGIVPDEIIRRPKDTFQGGSGMALAAAAVASDPIRFYNAEIRRHFGALTRA